MPGSSPGAGPPTRTVGAGSRLSWGPAAPAANGTASAAVTSPLATWPSSSSSPADSSAVVAITALPRKGTGATCRPSSSATTAASR